MLQYIVPVDEECSRQRTDVVGKNDSGTGRVGIAYTYPGQIIGRYLPKVFIGVYRYLIDFEPLPMVFFVKLSQCTVVVGRIFPFISRKIKEYDFAFQVAEPPFPPMQVG